jgi:IS30 family transposase
METLPEFLRNSITWDQGKEMARHAEFTVRTVCPSTFATRTQPWQRDTNENTTGCSGSTVLPERHRPVLAHPGRT